MVQLVAHSFHNLSVASSNPAPEAAPLGGIVLAGRCVHFFIVFRKMRTIRDATCAVRSVMCVEVRRESTRRAVVVEPIVHYYVSTQNETISKLLCTSEALHVNVRRGTSK